jgi:hypothetical protein
VPTQTQGKIERWHQTLKNRILLENYYCPVISKPRSRASSSTTINDAITKAYETSRRPNALEKTLFGSSLSLE